MMGEAIFQGQDGRQIKFFIQKDLAVERIETLQTQITANGGRIDTKVPIQGYVLIEPRSPEGERLIGCWESSDRPLRTFVPYTFVAACLEACKLIPQVFRKNGKALKFHIHSCINNEKVIEALRTRISHSGGDPFATELEADIIIADESTPSFSALNERFEHHHNTFVEGIPWVRQCVVSGVYENTPVVKKNMGGRIPGNKRTEFTPQDDNLLAGYIACRLPDPGMRGRTGNKLYHELCTRLDLYPWAERHPWQSWRERYKNNSARFNKLIATYLEHHSIPESGKGLYGFTRVCASPSISRAKQPSAVESESPSKVSLQEPDIGDKAEYDWGSQWPIKEGNSSPPPWGKMKRKVDCDNTEEPNNRKRHKSDHSGERELSSRSTCTTLPELSNQKSPQGTTNRSDLRSTRLNEVAEPTNIVHPEGSPRAQSRSPADSDKVIRTLDSSNEDVISEGDDVGPETQALLDASKVMLTSSGHFSRVGPILSEKDRESGSTDLTVDPRTLANFKGNDTVKLALLKIADDYRFLFNEVMEEYKELGQDLDATRAFFEEIRACISEKKSKRNKFSG